MKTINVLSAFEVVLIRNGARVTVKVPQGVSTQEDDVADHWYTQSHLANGGFGTPEYAAGVRAAADTAFVTAREAMRSYALMERAAQEAEAGAKLPAVEPAFKRLHIADDEMQGLVEGIERPATEKPAAAPKDPATPKPAKAPKAPKGDKAKDAGAQTEAGASTETDTAAGAEPAAQIEGEPGADAVSEGAAQEAEAGAGAATEAG